MNKRILIVSGLLLVVMLFFAGAASANGDNVSLYVNNSDGSALDGVKVYYNDYGNHWVLLGSTTGGNPVTATFADGSYNFKAVKDHTEQVATVSVTGTTSLTFQTSEYVVHVKDSTTADFPGIAASFNDYGNHYLSMGNTDGSGNASIELFPGTRKFKAAKNHTETTGTTTGTINFQTAKFTVHVDNSSGADFSGIAASFNDYGNHYLSMGNTDGSGNASIELFPGTRKFKAAKNHTEDTGDLTIGTPGGSGTINFQTAKAIGLVKDCDGTPLAGFKIAFNDYGNHWLNMGTTGVDGKASIELFPGTRTIRAWKDYTYEAKDLILTLTESTVEFNPTKIKWQYSGTIKYNDYGNHWKTMTPPFYIFPGTYDFMFDGTKTSVTVSGCTMDGSVLLITLKDSSGTGVSGGTAHLGVGGWPVIGTTDANGNLVYFHGSPLGNMRIRMGAPFYGGSQTSPVQDTTVNSVFNFQTQQVTIQLKDSAGTLKDGGVVRAGAGGWPVIGTTGDDGLGTLYHEHFAGVFKYRMSYNGTTEEQQHDVSIPFVFQTVQAVIQLKDHLGNLTDGGVVQFGIGGWPVIGTTGDSGTGTITRELFAGTYNFRMSYNYGTEEKSQDIGTPVVFQTGLIDLHFSGSIKHGVGGWPAYTGPTEMLPIAHRFKFSSAGHPSIEKWFTPTAGAVLEKSIVLVEFYDHADVGIDGATVKYYHSGWKNLPGQTGDDGSGLLFGAIDGALGNLRVRLYYGGGLQDKTQHQPTDSYYVFQTVLVTVNLKDHLGTLGTLPAEGTVKYYASGWKTFGTTSSGTVSKELLPLSYKFRMGYGGGSQDKTQNVGSSPTVDFQTALVTVNLKDHLGALGTLPAEGVVKYYASGWKTFGTTSGGTVNKELLPLSYKFRMQYGGATNDQVQNVGVDPLVVFTAQNALPTVKLLDSLGSGIQGGVVKYYASGWKAFGTTGPDGTVSKDDLLPGTYKFRMQYGGASMDIVQDISSNPIVTFQTKLVTVRLLDSGSSPGNLPAEGTVKYYASGWKTFGTTVSGVVTKEMLPMSYKFRMGYGGGSQDKTQDVNINQTVDFQTTLVTVNLKDHNGALGTLPVEGTVKYYASGWKTFGTTSGGTVSKELLPLSYKFRVGYGGGSQDQTQNVASNPLVEFQTTEVAVTLKNCDDDGVAGGTVKYYASGWKTLGTTDSNGEAKKELLPLSYKFRKQYGGASNDKTQNVGANPTVEFSATEVEFHFADTVKYYASGWKTLSGPTYMLPGTYKFKFGDTYQNIDISGCSMNKTVNILKLKDHNGYPLAGGTARGGYGSSYGTWHVPGSTDANGILFDFRDGTATNMSYEMRFNNTTQHKMQDVSVNSVFEFQTNLITLRMETCGSAPLDGGNPRYGNGSTYTTWWFPGGVTGSSAPGETAAEFFPGTYSFQMQYQATADEKVSVTIPDADTLLTWQTTNVALNYSGPISYGGSGDSRFFDKPSMELLPGTYKFNFRNGGGYTDLTFAGCEYKSSIVVLKLLDSTESGLAGGDFKYRIGWGDYTNIGTTDATGIIIYPISGLLTNTKFNVTYMGASLEKEQNIATDSFVVFHTVPVTAALYDSTNTTDMSSGATFEYRYGWDPSYTTLTGSTELLPVSTKVKVSYGGTSVEKSQNVGITPHFLFNTVSVTAALYDSTNTTDMSSGATFEYRYGWGSYTTLTGPTELLPVSTKIKVSYGGTSVEKSQNVGTNPHYLFQTGKVTSTTCTQYRYDWGSYMSFTNPMELLANSTKFSDADGPDTTATPVSGGSIFVSCP